MKENQFISRSLQQANCSGCMPACFNRTGGREGREAREEGRKGGSEEGEYRREMYLSLLTLFQNKEVVKNNNICQETENQTSTKSKRSIQNA